MSKILIANDHAGFQMKQALVKKLINKIDFLDLGTSSLESVDYPDYAEKLSKEISSRKFDKGLLICGSGIGMSIVANRFKNVRAALCMTAEMSRLAREHNDANILVLGSRLISEEEAIKCLLVFIKTKFEGGRHQTRLDKLNLVR